MPLRVLALFGMLIVVFVPATTADENPVCGLETNTPLVKAVVNTDCTVHAHVFYDLACLWGQSSKTFGTGPVRVTYYSCEPGPDPTSAPSGACPGTSANLIVEGSRIVINEDCTSTAYITPNIMCVGGWVGHTRQTFGPAAVDWTYCTGGQTGSTS